VTLRPLRTKNAIFTLLEEAAALAIEAGDVALMVQTARVLTTVIQLPDTIEPGQEVVGWLVRIVRPGSTLEVTSRRAEDEVEAEHDGVH
jgi:hypothetical protein